MEGLNEHAKRNCEGLMENFGDVAHGFSAKEEEEEKKMVCSCCWFLSCVCVGFSG